MTIKEPTITPPNEGAQTVLKKKRIARKHTGHEPSVYTRPEAPGLINTWFTGNRAGWSVFIGLILLTVIVYGNSLANGFVFDDHQQVVDNIKIRKLEYIPEILGFTGKPGYRPIRTISYALDFAIAGLQPWIYHLSNMVYHLITAFLVFLVVTRLTQMERLGAVAALLFLVHPVQTDAVTYISGRRDILSAMFYLIGFYLFLRRRDGGGWWTLPVALVAYLAGIFSKEMAVTLPAICFLYDFTMYCKKNPAGERTGLVRHLALGTGQTLRKYFGLYACFLAMTGIFLVFKLLIRNPSFMEGYHGGSFLATMGTELRVIAHFLGLLIFPLTLNSDYSANHFEVSQGLLETNVLLSAALVLGLLALSLFLFRKHHMVGFGILWFFITLLPVSHIFPHHELLAEHYLYLPIIGIVLVAALGYYSLERKAGTTLAASALLVVAALFAGRTILRNRDYRDHETFWTVAVRTAPNCSRAHQNLGMILSDRGNMEEARKEFETAISIDPTNLMAHYNLGFMHQKEGHWKEAEKAYRESLKIKEWFRPALINLSFTLSHCNRVEEALSLLKKAESRWPQDITILTNLSGMYKALKNTNEARAVLTRLCGFHPRHAEAAVELGLMEFNEKKYEEALAWFRKAHEAKPDYGRPYLYIGDCLINLSRLQEAVEIYEAYLERWPRSNNRRKIAGLIARLRKQLEDPEFAEKYKKHLEDLRKQGGPIRKVKHSHMENRNEEGAAKRK